MKIKMMNLSFYILFLFTIFSIFFVSSYINKDSRLEEEYLFIQLSSGDTLWDVAEQFADQHGLATTQFIKWVEEKNNIDGNLIVAGERIVIPVKKEHISDTVLLVADGSVAH
ncbi:LysM peptidoglycan-binding domain-containing protein [Bacillus salitolerans]|uniref:LysM peptidoglycan-binding domain-containing protein n=1 Tax=Bacillus salitolerans TaxID=1437434 RepID=A0ABW4LP96_9BACI